MASTSIARAPTAVAAAQCSSVSRRVAAALPPPLARRQAAALRPAVRHAATVKTAASRRVVSAVASEADTLPAGYVRYETMLVMRPNITEEERDRELAKFELLLKNEEAVEIDAMIRGRQRMAYPMKGHWEGIYVLYRYAAKRSTAQAAQMMLSKPDIESEGYLLRFMTFVL